MTEISYFTAIFFPLFLIIVFGLLLINKKANPLRKARNVYFAMYILHAVLFFGLMFTLPFTLGSIPLERNEISEVESIQDVKQKLKEQREDIEKLKNQVDQTRQAIWLFALIFMMLAPFIYYNLFKYNLEIEKLSGKRMGSFD